MDARLGIGRRGDAGSGWRRVAGMEAGALLSRTSGAPLGCDAAITNSPLFMRRRRVHQATFEIAGLRRLSLHRAPAAGQAEGSGDEGGQGQGEQH